jgi:ArsR family transcriptional regulator
MAQLRNNRFNHELYHESIARPDATLLSNDPVMKPEQKWTKSKNLLELADMLKALSHPSRMAIMYILSREGNKKMTVKSIYREMKMPQPVISRHLGILRASGLLNRLTEGQNTYYELCSNGENASKIINCFKSIK